MYNDLFVKVIKCIILRLSSFCLEVLATETMNFIGTKAGTGNENTSAFTFSPFFLALVSNPNRGRVTFMILLKTAPGLWPKKLNIFAEIVHTERRKFIFSYADLTPVLWLFPILRHYFFIYVYVTYTLW